MNGSPLYYAVDGTPMSLEDWAKSFEDPHKKIVQRTEVGEATVSTVWLGLDHQWGGGPPLIFETMIFGGEWDEHQWRYSTRDQAVADHERIVQALGNGSDPESWAAPSQ